MTRALQLHSTTESLFQQASVESKMEKVVLILRKLLD